MKQQQIKYQIKNAKKNDILCHLNTCNDYFTPSLSSRVKLNTFSEKIYSSAISFEAWNENILIGLVSCYFNKNKTGFINHASVIREFHKMGIFKKLLNSCINYGKELKFQSIKLEVEKENHIAKNIYLNLGFKFLSLNNNFISMQLHLDKEEI
tara:strand:+ start:271 stop:729 length:459 start_codon:yes stop_codon:yes gene_type:complete